MKKILSFLIGLLFLISCQQTAIGKPDNLIDEETMEDIIYDLALLDAIKSNDPASLDKKNIVTTTYIYDKYDIDSLQFANSNHYYASDVHNYLKMYKRIEDRLASQKTEVDSLIARKKTKKLEVKKEKLNKLKNIDSTNRKKTTN